MTAIIPKGFTLEDGGFSTEKIQAANRLLSMNANSLNPMKKIIRRTVESVTDATAGPETDRQEAQAAMPIADF